MTAMTPETELAALHAIATDTNERSPNRLVSALLALKLYADRTEALEELLTHLEEKAESTEFTDYEAKFMRPAYRDIADRLRKILDGLPEDVPDGQ